MSERLFLRLRDDPPCAPETTVPASTLTGFAVPNVLRSTVAHVTAYEERIAKGTEAVERVLPDGASRVLILLQPGTACIRVIGASATPVVLAMRGHIHGLSITLCPGATTGLFGIPANELSDCSVPWDTIVDRPYRDLPEMLASAEDDEVRVRLILDSFRAMRRASDAPSLHVVEDAASRLRADGGGDLSIRALAAEMKLSERRLQQIFAAQIGLSPSVWRRLQRLHATLRMLRSVTSPQWAQVALSVGYYDQSHLINEFRALSGLTPQQFLRRVVSDFSNTGTGPSR